ncbi:MAG: DUF6504 family protein [Arthrobacter sp.]|jgi:hypothetical protein|nr:DUF6504 family protein [Arthrobacter sp.]
MEAVQVDLTPAGVPLRFIWRGRTWHIGARPVRWFERRPWWAESPRAPKGGPVGLIDREIWQVQARLGRAGELATFELVSDQETGRWDIRRSAPAGRSSEREKS